MNRSEKFNFYLPQNIDPIDVSNFDYNFEIIDENLITEEQELTSTQKANARANLDLGDAALQTVANNLTTSSSGSVLDARQGKELGDRTTANESAVSAIRNSIAIVASGNTHGAITAGQYVYVHSHSSLSEGLYIASSNISANGTLSTSNLTAVSGGVLNVLNSKIDTIYDYTAYGPTYCFLKRKTNVIFIYGSSSGGLTLTGDNAWHSLTTIGPAFRPSYDVYFVGSTASGHSIAFHLATDGTLNYVTDANTSYWSYGGSYVI